VRPRGGQGARRPLALSLGGACALLAAAAPALGASTTSIEANAGLSAVRVAVDQAGDVAALYPAVGAVRLQRGTPGSDPESVPVPPGGVVDGFALGAHGEAIVLVRQRRGCAPLVALVRAGTRRWTREPLGGPPGASATLAVDPSGAAAALSTGCGGDLLYRTREVTGGWDQEPVGIRATANARLSLALSGGGAALAGVSGQRAGVLTRDAAGTWRRLPLPGGEEDADETVASLGVGFDGLARPLAVIARGPRRPLDASRDTLGALERVAARLDGTDWSPLPEAGAGAPVALASTGRASVVEGERGLRVETPAGVMLVPLAVLGVAVGPDGTLGYVPRARPLVLGSGPPPSLILSAPRSALWGARVALDVRLTADGVPLEGVQVRAGAEAAAVTATDGRATLRVLVTRTGSLAVDAAAPSSRAPAFASAPLVVRPRPARLVARARRTGRRVVVRGTLSGGAPLPGPRGRLWLVDIARGASGFLPGRPLASTSRRGAFSLRTADRQGARLALFFEGRTVRVGLPARG
jgi:hypothetical protein